MTSLCADCHALIGLLAADHHDVLRQPAYIAPTGFMNSDLGLSDTESGLAL